MKREKLLTGLICVLLSVCISFGGICCIVTAFDFPTDGLVTILVFSVLFASLLTCCMLREKNKGLLFGMVLVVVLAIFFSAGKRILGSLEAILYRITLVYNSAYGTGVVGSEDAARPEVSLTAGLCVITALVILVQVWTISRRHNAILAVLYGLLPLFVCLVVTDIVPDNWALLLLLTGLVLLILTNTVRRRDAAEGNRLTAMLLIPSCLMTMLLFWAVPREDYVAQQGQMQQSLSDWFWGLPFMPKLPGQSASGGGTGVVKGTEVDLSAIGPNNQMHYAVMDVKASCGGPLYLRGQALDAYDGRSWAVSEYSSGYDSGWPMVGLTQTGTVTVYTRSFESILYFPYYPGGENWKNDFDDGTLGNPGLLRRYTFDLMEAPTVGTVGLEAEQTKQCLQLPSGTRGKAEAHLARLPIDVESATTSQIVEAVGSYVQNSAQYDLNTDRMPGDQTDFALWFLEQSDTGYCVHFASAAVVLLRAADIPARYVTGYLFNAAAGKQVTVTADKAHAWVEYFDPNAGWRILDPTPASDDTVPQPSDENPVIWPDSNIEFEPTIETTVPISPDVTQPSGPDATVGTAPSGDDRPVEEKPDVQWLWMLLRVILWSIAALAVVVGQYLLRLRPRRKRMYTGPVNARALARWREVLRFCRLLKETPSETLEKLAEKAKFSQHKLTPEELKSFDLWLRQANERLKKKKFSLLLRLIWAV